MNGQPRRLAFRGCLCCAPSLPPPRRNLARRLQATAGGASSGSPVATAAGSPSPSTQVRDPKTTAATPHRIDVHHHISPPTWLDAVKKAKLDNPPLANWSTQKSLDDMDKAGIATAIASPTTPQVTFLASDKDTAARVLERLLEAVV